MRITPFEQRMASLDGQYFTEGNTTAMRMTKFFQQSIFSPVLVEAGLAFFAGFLFHNAISLAKSNVTCSLASFDTSMVAIWEESAKGSS